jgi:lysophospholipase L1-like esterase
MPNSNHLVLLGDSIFDNAAYVPGGPDVITQLRAKLPADWQATLQAVDGDIVQNIYDQLERLPAGATHLFVSIGGNDALGNSTILGDGARSFAEVLSRLADLREQFGQQYRKMLQRVLSHRLPTTVCTIYYPNSPDPTYQKVASTALTIFNDVIIYEAFQAGIPLIDLRSVCNEPSDYANPIEPSINGGEKITTVILKVVKEAKFSQSRTEVFY